MEAALARSRVYGLPEGQSTRSAWWTEGTMASSPKPLGVVALLTASASPRTEPQTDVVTRMGFLLAPPMAATDAEARLASGPLP
jgi:hypothetical protein